MAIKCTKAGGSDLSTPSDRIKPTDQNDTFTRFAGALIESSITFLQGINQSTILSEDASITDKDYSWAETELFSDSNGYNNHVDTGNTTARLVEDRYIIAGTLYDDFNDNSLDTNLWTVTTNLGGGIGTASVVEQNQRIEMNCANPGGNDENNAYLDSDTNYTDYLKWDAVTLITSATGINSVSIGGVVIVDVGENALTIYDDYTTGTWEIFKVGASTHRLYKDGVFVREIASALSGTVRFRCRANDGADSASHYLDNVYLNFDSSSYIQTNLKTLPSNISSGILNGNGDTSLSGTSITIDISTDGGSTYDVTDQPLDSIINLDGDDTDVILKINLKASGTSTPWLFGYAYQMWPQ